MADTCIVYYSRTGTVKAVAEKLQAKWNADIEPIKPVANFSGGLGAMRGIMQVMRAKRPLIIAGKSMKGYARVVLVAPVWADHIASPAATWLGRQPPDSKQTIEVVTVSASEKGDSAFDFMQKEFTQYALNHLLHVHRKIIDAQGVDAALAALPE